MIDPRELATHAGEIRQRGIGTTTVGVGEDFDEGLLSAMAEAGGGNFKYVANPAELREFFSEELQELFTVHATGFTIGFTCPHGARAELISAFPVTRNGKRFEVAIGDVAARDEIDLVFTVRVNPGAMNTTVPFAVTAAWTDPRQDQRHQATIALEPLNRAARSDVTNASADPLVQERSALQKQQPSGERPSISTARGVIRIRERGWHGRHSTYEKAPPTAAVRVDLLESDMLAAMPADAAYSQHDRKAAQEREYHRRRGRFETASRVEGSRSRGVEEVAN